MRFKLSETDSMAFLEGTRSGFPIGLGYFAVAFSLGIAARNAGLTPFQVLLSSLLCNASAGQYAGYTTITVQATYIEMAVMVFIANARYLLMSCALSQRMNPKGRLIHRFLMSLVVTDEIFAITVSRPGYLNPFYTYGAILVACPCWAVGTYLGGLAGNLMPLRLVSAFSVALYGMFLAVIIPPCRKSRVILGLIIGSFILSYGAAVLPFIKDISSGTRTIILTVVISSIAAILFPVKNENAEENR